MIRPFLRRASAAAALTTVAAAGAAAQVQRATFAEYASPVTREYQATPGRPVTSGGMDFYAAFGTSPRNALGTWGTDPNEDPEGALNLAANRGNSVGMYAVAFDARIDMNLAGEYVFGINRTFDLFSIDVAHQFNEAYLVTGSVLQPFSLTFFGFQNPTGGSTVSQTFNIGVPAGGVPLFNTLQFGGQWRNLYSVAWFQSSAGSVQSHQFTNVTFSPVPEPGTYALVVVGLAGVLVARRRRAA